VIPQSRFFFTFVSLLFAALFFIEQAEELCIFVLRDEKWPKLENNITPLWARAGDVGSYFAALLAINILHAVCI
jgi:hypothetical protein